MVPHMNILITGGAGFIGSNVATYYLQKNHRVIIFDSLSKVEGGQNIASLKNNFGNQLTFVSQDIRNYDAVKDTVKDQDVVFHLAGHTISDTAITHPRYDFEVNGLGTLNILESLRAVNRHAIVFYASSSKVYGNLTGDKKKSFCEAQALDFTSPIGCSIGAADQYVHDFSRSYGLKTVVFRLSTIYGEHQWGWGEDDWISYVLRLALQNKPITIYDEVFDPLYISDLLSAFDLSWKHIDTSAGQIFNIGGGTDHAVSKQHLILIIEKLLDKKLTTVLKPTKIGSQPYYVTNFNKAQKLLGWLPTTPLDQGLSQTLNWLKDHLEKNAV